MLENIERVLRPDGVFIEITYGVPNTRVNHLTRRSWGIEYCQVEGRYVYICEL